MSPQKRGKVRGIRVWGLISISAFFSVWMYTCSSPALFSGLSINISRLCIKANGFFLRTPPPQCQLLCSIKLLSGSIVTWWVISGRTLPGSLPLFIIIFLCWSQFSSSNVFPTFKKQHKINIHSSETVIQHPRKYKTFSLVPCVCF